MKGNKGTALITGASSGIGFEIAKCFAEEGHNVILVARSQSELRAIADDFEARYNVQAMPIGTDLFAPGAAEELHQEIKEAGITVNFLVNDAGAAVLTELFLNDMLARNEGRILRLGSIAGNASRNLEGTNVTVTALRPGESARDGYEALMRGDSEVFAEEEAE